MRYYFTDFYHWEQPKIDQLRKEGKYVYSVIDEEGEHYSIARRGFCNRISFLITDADVIPEGGFEISDEEFWSLNGEEDVCLSTPLKDVSAECAAKRKEYESRRYA